MGLCNNILQFLAAFGIVFLVILNIVCLLLGIGIIVVGYKLEQEVDKHDDVMALLDKVELGDITLKGIVDLLFTVILIVGIFTIILSAMGIIGASCTLRILLAIYSVIVFLCIVFELVVLSYWIKLILGINEWLISQFYDLLEKYNGPTGLDLYSIGWNLIFILFGCCGVTPTTQSNNDFQSLPSKWWSSSSRGNDLVPHSCCDDATIHNYLNYTNTNCTQGWTDYYESGCYDVFHELFDTLTKAAVSLVSFLLFFEALAIGFSIIIIIKESVKKKVHVV